MIELKYNHTNLADFKNFKETNILAHKIRIPKCYWTKIQSMNYNLSIE